MFGKACRDKSLVYIGCEPSVEVQAQHSEEKLGKRDTNECLTDNRLALS